VRPRQAPLAAVEAQAVAGHGRKTRAKNGRWRNAQVAEAEFRRISKYKLNATDDAPDFRDLAYRPALRTLPYELPVPNGLSILDQGREGACTGFGLAAVINMQNKLRGRDYTVSTRMLYEMARKYDEWPGEKYEGSSCRGAIKGWYAMGVCREDQWQYDPKKPGVLTVERARKARENTVGAYYRMEPKVTDFHAALSETGALFVSARVHTGWRHSQVKDGVIPFRRQQLGGHAFAIVGYDARGFWVQNSWGEEWGADGLALWTYEDWQANIRDAWVFRMAVPSLPIWHLPPGDRSGLLGDKAEAGRSPNRAEIAGHFVHIDDGEFRDNGRYWSNAADVDETAELLADSGNYRHLLLYAHGGLNTPRDSARRISAMKQVFKDNAIYPYHFMYDTGLMEEIRDVVLGKQENAGERAAGFPDWMDRLLERMTRKPGRALWREMKQGAHSPFLEGRAGTHVVDALMMAFAANPKLEHIHIVGHSTGAVLLAHLLEAIDRGPANARISTCSLMAPAATVNLWKTHYYPHLVTKAPVFGIDQMTVYNLDRRLEQDDDVANVYHKSLLYLVSHAFEEDTPSPLLGMRIHSQDLEKKVPNGQMEFCYSHGRSGPNVRTTARAHGAFDNDVETMNDILKRVLGKRKPKRLFTSSDLNY
jgi:hypothetical protein